MRPTTCELSEFSGRTHKLGLCVCVSGHLLTVLCQKLRHSWCFLTTGLIFTVLIIICFYILSGIDCSESFHIVIYMTQVTCSYVSIIHYLGLSIYVHMLVSRLKSDCDCYFYCTFNTLTTQYMVVIESIFIRSFISAICVYVVFLSHNH